MPHEKLDNLLKIRHRGLAICPLRFDIEIVLGDRGWPRGRAAAERDDDAAEQHDDSCCAVHIDCFHPTGESSLAVCELQPVLRGGRTYVSRYSEGRT